MASLNTYMKDEESKTTSASAGISLSWGLGITILLVTLGIWAFFYEERMPLDAGSTSFLALLVTVCVVSARWFQSRFRKSKTAPVPGEKK